MTRGGPEAEPAEKTDGCKLTIQLEWVRQAKCYLEMESPDEDAVDTADNKEPRVLH